MMKSEEVTRILENAIRIGKGFHFIGLYNIQFIVDRDEEVSHRIFRSLPRQIRINLGSAFTQ